MSLSSVSVIIPCDHQTNLLEEAIRSVLAQTHQAREIIVVDDGANPEVQTIAFQYPIVRYIHHHNGNIATARNVALQASQGDYIVFLDPTDRLLPTALEVGVNTLDAVPNCGLMVGICQAIDTEGLPLKAAVELMEQSLAISFYQTLLSGTQFNPTARIFFRRSVFERVGRFNNQLVPADYYDLCLRAAATFLCCRCNQVLVEYREPVSAVVDCRYSHTHCLQVYLQSLSQQWNFAKRHPLYRTAYTEGKKYWCRLYGSWLIHEMVEHLRQQKFAAAQQTFKLLVSHYPQGILKHLRNLQSSPIFPSHRRDRVHQFF